MRTKLVLALLSLAVFPLAPGSALAQVEEEPQVITQGDDVNIVAIPGFGTFHQTGKLESGERYKITGDGLLLLKGTKGKFHPAPAGEHAMPGGLSLKVGEAGRLLQKVKGKFEPFRRKLEGLE